jgi:hypothetical protein
MLELDVMLKFWELLVALGAMLLIVIGSLVVFTGEKRRRTRLPFYVEAGGVALSLGEERLLEALARASAQDQNLTALARVLGVDEVTAYGVARLLKEKGLITEVVNLDGSSPKFELAATGNDAALARGYIKLM